MKKLFLLICSLAVTSSAVLAKPHDIPTYDSRSKMFKPPLPIEQALPVTGINMKAAPGTVTNAFRVPANFRFFLTGIRVETISVTGAGSGVLQIGSIATSVSSVYTTPTMNASPVAGKIETPAVGSSLMPPVASGDTVTVTVGTASTGTAHAVTVYLMGYFLP